MDPHDELVSLLIDGARYGDMEDVESAIAQHVNVDSTDSEGRTGAPPSLAFVRTRGPRGVATRGACSWGEREGE
eukprot:gene16354-22554_t